MAVQRHVIGRQTLELTVSSESLARRIQLGAGSYDASSLMDVIDRCCSAVSRGDLLDRIASLHIDLGTVDARNLERDLRSRLSDHLPAALVEALATTGREPGPTRGLDIGVGPRPAPEPRSSAQLSLAGRVDHRPAVAEIEATPETDGTEQPVPVALTPTQMARLVELLTVFAQTGTLPWWADAKRPAPLEEALSRMLAEAPVALRDLLGQLAIERGSLERLVIASDDELLTEIAAVVAPEPARALAFGELAELFGSVPMLTAVSPALRRRIVWTSLLFVLLENADPSPADVVRGTVARVAREANVPAEELASDLLVAARAAHAAPKTVAVIEGATATPSSRPAQRRSRQADALSAVAVRLSEGRGRQWRALVEQLPAGDGRVAELLDEVERLLGATPAAGELPVATSDRLFATLEEAVRWTPQPGLRAPNEPRAAHGAPKTVAVIEGAPGKPWSAPELLRRRQADALSAVAVRLSEGRGRQWRALVEQLPAGDGRLAELLDEVERLLGAGHAAGELPVATSDRLFATLEEAVRRTPEPGLATPNEPSRSSESGSRSNPRLGTPTEKGREAMNQADDRRAETTDRRRVPLEPDGEAMTRADDHRAETTAREVALGAPDVAPGAREVGAGARATPGARPQRPGDSRVSGMRGENGSRVGGPPARAAETQLGEPNSPAIVDVSFSESDRAYIDNCGLVLLVPFLINFFARLGLTQEQSFRSSEARQRAVGLLQYLADGDPAPPEYLVSLNKVLCGVDSVEMFEFGDPVRDEEAEECNHLLSAAIEHAEVFGELSTTGLQGTFLIRRGVLSSEHGTWVLRVERETYDVVLDRLPWSFEWVTLPWMRAPMRVEW